MKNQSTPPEKAKDRLDVLARQAQFEKEGKFDQDVEIDPPQTKFIKPGEVDYKRKRFFSKLKARFSLFLGQRFINKMKKAKMLQIEKIVGAQHITNLKSGAVLTCNHFNPMESFAVQVAYQEAKPKGKKLFRVIKEANYTNFPGFFGFMMRNCNTLPLSENKTAMAQCLKATNELLCEGHLVLVYPEQSMWWNYRKPRPLKPGAFRFAVKSGVPVVPMFITMKDSDVVGPDGFAIQKYTIHIEKPIYADKTKTDKENIEFMKAQNERVWKEIFEKNYETELQYQTK